MRFFLILSLFVAPQAGAAEVYDFFDGVRSLGMGGSYTAVVNDETSLLTNPAGLAKLRDVMVVVANPEVQGSQNDTQIANLSNASVQEPSDLLNLLNQNKGLHWNAKAQVFPAIVAPDIGFGLLGKYQYDASVNTAGTDFRYDYTNDFAAVFGFSLRFFGGILKIGVDSRYVNRIEMHKDFNPTVTAIDMNQNASEGGGLAADVGMIVTVPVALLPSIAVVVRDAGTTNYGLSSGMFLQTQTRPADTPQTVDAGFSLSPILSNHTRMTITGDYHDALNAWEQQGTLVHVHGGVEFNFSDFFFLRGGVNQGYWTAGFEIATRRFQLQAASYGEEIGTAASPQEDRRYVGEIAFRF